MKNKTDRLQMLGSNKTMRLNVWFDDPKIGNSQPFEYKIGGELVKGDAQRVVRPQVVGEAVDGALVLRLEGAEEPIPDDEDAGVVAVQVARIGAVVHAVMLSL